MGIRQTSRASPHHQAWCQDAPQRTQASIVAQSSMGSRETTPRMMAAHPSTPSPFNTPGPSSLLSWKPRRHLGFLTLLPRSIVKHDPHSIYALVWPYSRQIHTVGLL
ncbi:hypothetical protein J6590_062696 [Homalodisca vitripennis]|nr:hypothetical protein J6590_062696 [Homalodisca vitripennis]